MNEFFVLLCHYLLGVVADGLTVRLAATLLNHGCSRVTR